jgi:hypothetical protein
MGMLREPEPTSPIWGVVRAWRRSRPEFERQIGNLRESLQQAADFVKELDESLEQRARQLGRLQEQYGRYSRLLEIEEANAAALILELEVVVRRGLRRERWMTALIGLGVGLAAGVAITWWTR